ncbi:subtilisin-like protease Glyma18g48580, partial [Trifolium pratense]|uniref:subtilisin-like protease Glyma18g48580 n=1 Tax=Trifolium pratense TaxID=57577 RepID=UPI001E695A80
YLGAHSHGHGPHPTSVELEIATNSHYDLLSSTLGSREKAKEAIIYSYNKHINGFAALLEEEQATYIAKKVNVVSVFLSKSHKLHTTRSWEFIGLQRNGKSTAWQKGKFGENTIIVNIDSGVWPESQSFIEKGFGPIPSKWHGGKACQISQFGKLKKNPCNSDGVDILSLSVAGQYLVYPEDIFTDEVSIGAFHALSRNISVVASAGNDGPTEGSVVNIAPWVFTIAAITGASLFVTLPPNKSFSLILGTDGKLANATDRAARLCRPGTLDPSKVKGKIVGCDREGNIKSVAEGQEALSAGAKGMLLSNRPQQGKTTLAEPHVLSCVGNGQDENTPVIINTTEPAGSHAAYDITSMDSKLKSGTTIRFSGAKVLYGRKPAPVMASFSSRGPNKIQPSILKPDVTAPGVNILAAYSLFASASNLVTDNRTGFPFNVMQGTSMSCPHVAGIAGLLKTLHPNWSPAAIKSAIMTTATTLDKTNRPIQDAFKKKQATPFAYGSGHVQPDLAIDPGLVYDLGIKDYLNFLCAYGYNQQLISALNFNGTFVCSGSHSIEDFNYPSITLPNLGLNVVNVTRTVTNVGSPGTYVAKTQLTGYKIAVVPNSLTFKKIGEKKTFQVIVQATNVTPRKKYQFGNLQWTDGKHIVRSPITVKRK